MRGVALPIAFEGLAPAVELEAIAFDGGAPLRPGNIDAVSTDDVLNGGIR